jgi:hypothetical protein
MGLLDDAIREHLDLKRRRGADPTEVEREEREVLGPVRPRVEAAREVEPEYAVEDDLEHEPIAHDAPWDDEPADDVEPLPPAPAYDPHQIQPLPPAPAYDPHQIAPLEPDPDPYAATEYETARHASVEREPDPEPYLAEAGHRPPDTGETTVEYSVEDALEEEDSPREGSDEDVLEETPDFLQDTPDHDRLWFEQRPPRDFDFDG